MTRFWIWIGVALRQFHDWLGSVFGVDGVLGLDVVLEDPVVLSTEASIGTAGSTRCWYRRSM